MICCKSVDYLILLGGICCSVVYLSFTGDWMGVLQRIEETCGACQGLWALYLILNLSWQPACFYGFNAIATILAHSLSRAPRACIKAHQTRFHFDSEIVLLKEDQCIWTAGKTTCTSHSSANMSYWKAYHSTHCQVSSGVPFWLCRYVWPRGTCRSKLQVLFDNI
jgi:hypothetical protein